MAVTHLEKLPVRSQTYHVADYVELRCVVGEDKEYSKSDLVSARQRSDDLGKGPDEDAPGDDDPPGVPALTETEAADDHDPEVAADRRSAEADNVWRHLRERARGFGDTYPFDVIDHESIRLRKLTPPRRFYLFLLIASSLRYLPKKDENKLTRPFERLGLEVVRTHLPIGAEVHVFGTTAGKDDHYKGNLWSRLQTLRADLRITLKTDADRISRHNVGDAGVDIVAWVPPGDDLATGMIAIFAQCTCSAKWPKKLSEGTEDAWNRRVSFDAPLINLMIIPFYFRAADGSWFDEDKLHKGVLVDRLRIIRRLTAAGTALPVPGCYPATYVRRCLAESISLAA